MTYNPLKLCTEKDGKYSVDPAVMFPATIKRIQEVVAGKPPTEVMTPGWPGRPDREPVADKFLRQAEAFTPEDWELGLTPYVEPHEGETMEETALVVKRRAVLDLAESWFKRSLVLAVGHTVNLHISRNADYRR